SLYILNVTKLWRKYIMFKNKRLIFITSCLLLIMNYPSFAGDVLRKNIYLNEVNKFVNSENITYNDMKRLINEINRFDVNKKKYSIHIFKGNYQNISKELDVNIVLRRKYDSNMKYIQNSKKDKNNLRDLR
ncbi:MAG: hypothetical protein WBO99_05825, partial [Leptotrichiaceae bacterium]